MLTFLSVEKPKKRAVFFLRNKVYVEEKEVQGINARYIRYVQRAGKIRWDKIKKLCSDDSDRLLTEKALTLPKNLGLMRFESYALKERLCLNAAIEVLKLIKSKRHKLKVAVYDPEGLLVDSAEALLRFTDSITVVTGMTGFYSEEARRIMDESGAVLKVSKNLKALESAQLVVTPAVLRVMLPLSKQAVVLTVDKPLVLQKCRVYWDYELMLSDELESLIPKGIDKVYFASAIYALCHRFELGSEIPEGIAGEGVSHTSESLAKYLINI